MNDVLGCGELGLAAAGGLRVGGVLVNPRIDQAGLGDAKSRDLVRGGDAKPKQQW